MTKITVNYKNHTLELSRKFADAAAKYGTEEYKELQEVRRDYPGYKVNVVKSRKDDKKKENMDAFKGLTYDYMEKYIKAHDEDGSHMADFLILRGKSEEAVEALADSASYREIRDWFLATYPAIKQFYTKRAALLNKASAKAAA